MIVEFRDKKDLNEHRAFVEWRVAHLDSGETEDAGDGGYYLAFETKSRARLHAANCMHHGGMNWSGWLGSGTEPPASMTRKRMVCADTLPELTVWASEQGIHVENCPHCAIDQSRVAKAATTAEINREANPNKKLIVQDNVRATEGIAREITITTRSRSEPLRRAALERAHGICEACGTDYSMLASGLGIRVLQVHHRQQLALTDEPVLNGLDDLAVLCANCHLMIHADINHALSVEELRRRLEATTRQGAS